MEITVTAAKCNCTMYCNIKINYLTAIKYRFFAGPMSDLSYRILKCRLHVNSNPTKTLDSRLCSLSYVVQHINCTIYIKIRSEPVSLDLYCTRLGSLMEKTRRIQANSKLVGLSGMCLLEKRRFEVSEQSEYFGFNRSPKWKKTCVRFSARFHAKLKSCKSSYSIYLLELVA